jgi:hypothetical protein
MFHVFIEGSALRRHGIYPFLFSMFLLASCVLRTDMKSIIDEKSRDKTSLLALVGAQATSSTGVDAAFSSAVEPAGAQTPGNYSIAGLAVTAAVRDTADHSTVHLTTSSQVNSTYTLIVSGVKNIDGRPLGFKNSISFEGDSSPRLQSAGSFDNTTVIVYFTEDVELSSAQVPANYSIPGLTVFFAARDTADTRRVNLTTSPQAAVDYTISVSGVRDLTGNAVASPSSVIFTGTAAADTTPPTLLGAALADGSTLEVCFSEPMDPTTCQMAPYYDIRDSSNNPIPAISAAQQVDQSIVRVRVGCFFSKSVYTLTASTSLTDKAAAPNNLSGPPANTASFAGQGTDIFIAEAVSTSGVRVRFSRDVEKIAAETAGNYSIPGLAVAAATRDAADYSIVTLATSVQEDINYTLTVSGFIDQDFAVFGGDVAPCVSGASSYGNTRVLVCFSEEVDPVSAQNKANYTITPSIPVLSAALDTLYHSRVMLTTGSQAGNTTYTLATSAVRDLTGNPLVSPTSATFRGTGTGDSTPPSVLSASIYDGDTVEVCFSEPMDRLTSETDTNYTLRDNAGNAISILDAVRQTDTSRVWLDVTGLLDKSLYTLKVSSSVKDAAYNPLAGFPANTVSFAGGGSLPDSFGEGPVVSDPFDSAGSFGMLAKYRGWIYLGPASTDNAVYRMKPDGSAAGLVQFRFHKGSTTTTSLDPGPDGEDGIDCIASGELNGTEYLVFGPANANGLDYLYYTSEYGGTLHFTAMDLSSELGGYTVGVSAMSVSGGRLYVGFPDTVLVKPYFHAILVMAPSPVKNSDFFNLDGGYFPRIGSYGSHSNGAGKVGIDSFGVYNERLFLANGGKAGANEDGGIVQSTTQTPRSADTYPGDWQDVTPTGLGAWYDGNKRYSLELGKTNELTPADKAFPAMTEFNGKLYVIRNTTGSSGGPQLWRWDGSSWVLAASNGSGITNMGFSGNTRATMLVANGDRLYLGYDNTSTGVQVWRSRSGVTDPLTESDFEAVDVNGLGDPAKNLRIYHALSAQHDGVDYLWLLCGKPGETLRVYRTKN